jgi:RHS repeat-associated protein
MSTRSKRSMRGAGFAALISLCAGQAHADYTDYLVQAPELKAPQRGSLAGAYGDLSIGPRDLARGSFTLPSPFSAPSDRGPLLADLFPAYSPEAGQSEWGMGFHTGLSVRRHRELGELDFASDELATPWGIARRGDDGKYYPVGLRSKVVLTLSNAALVARLEDGSTLTFSTSDAVQAAEGRGVYEWFLSSVIKPNGDRTELSYLRNDTGRPFVSEVRYGGRAPEVFQYTVSFDYQLLGTPVRDFRAGREIKLDRRVSRVSVKVYDVASAGMKTRYRYDLAYTDSPAGSAFFLASVQRTFASGASEPAFTYGYNFAESELGNAHLTPVPVLDTYLGAVGAEGIQPTSVSFMDIDRDGRVDLEHHYGGTLIKRTDAGFEYQALPVATGGEDPVCRPAPSWDNAPRTLVRMQPSSAEPQVLVTEPVGNSGGTVLTICDRPGFALHKQQLTEDWNLGPNVRVVDLDRDLKPDFLRVFEGGYQVMRNVSTGGHFAFQVESPVGLELPYQPVATWVHDMNGDTVPDLVARSELGLDVWYGLGERKFDSHVQSMQLFTVDNQLVDHLDQSQFVFTDANKDGLTDVILAQQQYMSLYTNRGQYFAQFDVPGFSEVSWDISLPVAVDLEGHGEEQAVMVHGQNAFAVTLSQPSAGLLVSADDGRGGLATFAYERSRPTPGIQQRPPMLVQMAVRGVGLDDLTYRYDYDNALFHSQAQHLLGFGLVQMHTPTGVAEASFYHDDDVQGMLTRSRIADLRVPGVYKVEERSYQKSAFQGVVWWQDKDEQSYFADDQGQKVQGSRTEYLEYAQLCAKRERRTTLHGAVEYNRDFAQPGAFAGVLHCLAAHETAQATHPGRATLNVTYGVTVTRDANGLVTGVRSETAGDNIEVQHAEYDAQHRLSLLRSPAGGQQTFSWDAQTGMLLSTVQPDGVTATVTRDPSTDLTVELMTARDSSQMHESFRYDALERLAQRWNDVNGSSASAPLESISYAYAGNGRPASVIVKTLLDASASAYSELAQFSTSSGQSIATATRQPGGWAFGPVQVEHRSDARTDTFTRAPLESTLDAHAITMEMLVDPARMALRGQTWTSPVGDRTSREYLTIMQGVQRVREASVSIAATGLSTVTRENGTLSSEVVQDGSGRILRSVDTGGALTTNTYDALGRIVSVSLPGGGSQMVRYDAHGRVARVDHPGVSSVTYAYAPVSGMLASKTFAGSDGVAYRRVEFQQDAIGRVIGERHVRLPDNSEKKFAFGYDGSSPFGATIAGQRGFRTSVVAPGYKQELRYRADGQLTRTNTELTQFRLVQSEHSYTANGTTRGMLRKVFNATGQLLAQVNQEAVYDSFGRLAELRVNGATLATVHYDSDGRADHVELRDGQTLVFEHDPITREQVGYVHDATAFLAEFRTERNNRGLVSAERITWTEGNNAPANKDRIYDYDARGFLKTSGTQSYQYGADGLPTRTVDSLGTRTFTRSGKILKAGTVSYVFDAAGRIISRGSLNLEYGPSGQLDKATRGTDVFTFIYDEAGQRVGKFKNGAPVAMYLGDAMLTADGLFEPVRVAGLTVGVLENGEFHALAVDARGTLLGDRAFDPSTPYGMRTVHAPVSAVLDYAGKGYDADIESLRMGVRDYDPFLGRFMTPDPLFAVDTGKCADSPVECNLYGYAGNDPVSFVDPSGTTKEAMDKIIERRVATQMNHAKGKGPLAMFRALMWASADKQTLEIVEMAREMPAQFRKLVGDDSSSPGVTFLFGSDAKDWGAMIHGAQGAFVIAGHGGPGYISSPGQTQGNGEHHIVDMPVDDIVALAHDDGFKDGTPILLLSCNGGVAPKKGLSMAQKLADRTGSQVMAPGDYFWSDGKVGHYIGGADAFDTSGTWVVGKWVVVQPSKLPPSPSHH